MIPENVENVRERIKLACQRAARNPEGVTLIAVSKTFGAEYVREASKAGIGEFGENFVQELVEKRKLVSDPSLHWHFIGHLQTNKVKSVVPWIHCIHSVDSLHLGKELSKQAVASGGIVEMLVEVNTTGEATKFGAIPSKTRALVEELRSLSNLNVAGLMTIGRFLPDPEASRPAFRTLRELRNEIESTSGKLPHLSMGMTNDFEVAIEEGATMIRVGTAIFGPRTKRPERTPKASL